MVDTQSLELLTDSLVIPSPIAPITPTLQYSLAPIPATPATALTVNTALPTTIAPRLKTVSAVPNLRRYVGPGLTRMHPYYYVQYVPLSLKQDLVRNTFVFVSLFFSTSCIFLAVHVIVLVLCRFLLQGVNFLLSFHNSESLTFGRDPLGSVSAYSLILNIYVYISTEGSAVAQW